LRDSVARGIAKLLIKVGNTTDWNFPALSLLDHCAYIFFEPSVERCMTYHDTAFRNDLFALAQAITTQIAEVSNGQPQTIKA